MLFQNKLKHVYRVLIMDSLFLGSISLGTMSAMADEGTQVSSAVVSPVEIGATPITPKTGAVTTAINILQAQATQAVDSKQSQVIQVAKSAKTQVALTNNVTSEAANTAEVSSEQQFAALTNGVEVFNSKLLTKIYAERDFKPLWNNEKSTDTFMDNFIPWALSDVSAQAVNSLSEISQLPEGSDEMTRDILLSDAFVDYLYYRENVKKYALRWLYGRSGYRTKQPTIKSVESWVKAVNDNTDETYMLTLQPRNKEYLAAIKYISNNLPTEKIKKEVTFDQKLRPGQKSSKLSNLVIILKSKGVLNAEFKGTRYNGELVKAVEKLQAKKGLKADGVIGNNTLAIINNTQARSLYKLAINAQRISLLPNYENGVFVNIPTFNMQVYENGKDVFQSKVIVGTTERKTPVMESRLSNVVINPPWNAPTRLINEDLIPKVRKDPSYIYRHGYTIIDRRGRVIDPYTIDWMNMTVKEFPYRLRQAPGGSNGSALGFYKFNMPSKEAIYLHDTPHREAFSRSYRALSSGCVRVGRADAFASYLLKQVGWSDAHKHQARLSKKTVSVNVKRAPVYLYYVTAWVSKGGIHYAPDIYKYDNKLPKMNVNWSSLQKFVMN